MPFDYVIYLMMFISALYALNNGIKKELFCLISSSASLLIVFLFLGEYLSTLDLFKSFILDLENTCLDFFSVIKVNTNLISVFAFYVLPFLIIYFSLSFIWKLLFLNKNKHLKLKHSLSNKVGSLIIGLIVGIEISIIVFVLFANVISLDVSGISEHIIKHFPQLEEIYLESCLLG